jgi:thioredoxin
VPARLVTEFSFDCAGHPDPVPGTHGAPSIATVNATVETFPTQVLEAPVPMLVQFWATWCGPCKMLSPVLADLVAEQAGRIGLARVDIDAESALAAAHNVMAIPTTILFSHGAEMRRIVGAKPKAALLAEIADVLTTTASVARTQSVDLLVPCSLHGELYVDATDPDHPVAVGCQDPGTLGDRPAQLYRPLDELGTDDYRVFASVIRFGAYLVLPHRYRVGRAAPGHPGVAEWSPLMRWIQELDATHDTALPCRLLANLQPDIPPAAMASLTARLAELTPNPTVLLPTTFGSGVTSFNATVWNTTHPVTSTLSGDTVQITVDVPFNEAVVLNRMLTSPAPEDVLVGNANYVLGDGTTLAQVELHLDLGRLTGPWPDGPVLAEPTAPGTITVTSHAESPARVSQLRQGPPGTGVLADTPGLSVPPGGSVTVAVDATLAPGARPVAAYTLDEASAVAIDQERIYIEDLHTTITLVNDLEMARNGITGAEVSLRLDDHPDALTVTLTPEEPLYEVDLVQPIVADRQNTTNALHVTAVVHVQGGPDRGGDHLADLGAGSLIRLSTVLAGG